MRSFLCLIALAFTLTVDAAPIAPPKSASSTAPTASAAMQLPQGWNFVTCTAACYINFGPSSVDAPTATVHTMFLQAGEGRWVFIKSGTAHVRHLSVGGTAVLLASLDG